MTRSAPNNVVRLEHGEIVADRKASLTHVESASGSDIKNMFAWLNHRLRRQMLFIQIKHMFPSKTSLKQVIVLLSPAPPSRTLKQAQWSMDCGRCLSLQLLRVGIGAMLDICQAKRCISTRHRSTATPPLWLSTVRPRPRSFQSCSYTGSSL